MKTTTAFGAAIPVALLTIVLVGIIAFGRKVYKREECRRVRMGVLGVVLFLLPCLGLCGLSADGCRAYMEYYEIYGCPIAERTVNFAYIAVATLGDHIFMAWVLIVGMLEVNRNRSQAVAVVGSSRRILLLLGSSLGVSAIGVLYAYLYANQDTYWFNVVDTSGWTGEKTYRLDQLVAVCWITLLSTCWGLCWYRGTSDLAFWIRSVILGGLSVLLWVLGGWYQEMAITNAVF